LCPGGVHRPHLSIPECDPVEIVEGLWIDLVSGWKDSEDSELLVDLGTKLCQINKPVSNSGENMDNRVGLPAKSS
jgi:hypothetical protein